MSPRLPRLLEMSNDVEKNPGPPKVPRAAANIMNNKDSKESSVSSNGKKAKKEAGEISNAANGCNGELEEESLKSVVEKQSELIRQQGEDIDSLRKTLEDNVRVTEDFKAELSEIRKNWQSINSVGNGEEVSSSGVVGGGEASTTASVKAKLDSLALAYNDIQDRLYEIDKSWKNNVVIYGIPCEDGKQGSEEDPAVTEEKV